MKKTLFLIGSLLLMMVSPAAFALDKREGKVTVSISDRNIISFGSDDYDGDWQGFYLGFMNDNKMPAGYDFSWGGSFSMQFNPVEANIALNRRGNMGLTTGFGLEYQRYLFSNDEVSIRKNEEGVVVGYKLDEELDITRSTFKNLYLTIPVIYGVTFKGINVGMGVVGGLRMHTKTKVVYDDAEGDKKKQKGKGNFNMIPFKADVTGRISYEHVSIFANYTITRAFEKDKGPNIMPLTIGIGYSI